MANALSMAVPIQEGKLAQWKQFMQDLNGKYRDAYRESRQKLNIRERVFLQQLPQGDFVVLTLTGENPKEAFQHFGDGNDEFSRWFQHQVKDVHGMDLSNPPQEGMPVLYGDTEDKQTLEAS
ncbi:hypothetical protein ACXYMU_17110 [Pontibacter sp. CAU 1760]